MKSLLAYAKENHETKPSLSFYIPGVGVLAISFGRFVFVLERISLPDEVYIKLLGQ